MNSIRFSILFFLICLISTSLGQINASFCGFDEHLKEQRAKDPKWKMKKELQEQQIAEWIKNNATKKTTTTPLTIPVVFHVLYENAAENVSDSIIRLEIKSFNEDFSLTNADTTIIPSYWKNVAANAGIQFCLAKQDPQGNPSSGIVRTATTMQSFTNLNNVINASQGGTNTWDQTKYLNIWVCDLDGNPAPLGVGLFPGSNFEGLFIDYTIVGNGSGVTSHELGHCFGLYHIWGDDGGACGNVGDQIADTPDQGDILWTCGPSPVYDACQTTGNGIMWMNYMNYTNCMAMFTNNQVTRMKAIINAYYLDLTTSTTCDSIIINQDDVATTAITAPTGILCQTTINPTVTIKNNSSIALTSCKLNYQIDLGTVLTYNWTGNLASLASANINLPTITTTQGSHTLTVTTSDPNGNTDVNQTNDQKNTTFQVIITGQSLPFSEGFEGTNFPPSNWKRNNPDGSYTWERTTAAAKTGTASAYVNNKKYTTNGAVDELVLPALDFTGTAFNLKFQLAYQLLSDPNGTPNWSDTLVILASTDCGVTFTELYRKHGTNLVTATPIFSNNEFFPATTDWRQETVNLNSLSGNKNVSLKFKHTTDYENNLFIDDVLISNLTGIGNTSINNGGPLLWPNPTNNALNISIPNQASNIEFKMHDLTGKCLINQVIESNATNANLIDLSSLPTGIYITEMNYNNKRYYQRISLLK